MIGGIETVTKERSQRNVDKGSTRAVYLLYVPYCSQHCTAQCFTANEVLENARANL